MLLLVGAGIQGGQLALNALSTAYYPCSCDVDGRTTRLLV
jgi:hypothetical protein